MSNIPTTKSPKKKQQCIKDFFNKPLNLPGYQVFTSGVIDFSKPATKPTVRKVKPKTKSPRKSPKVNPRNSLDRWMETDIDPNRKTWTQFKDLTSEKSTKTKPKIGKEDSFEKYGMVLPSADKILENKKLMLREAEALDSLDVMWEDHDLSIPESLKSLITSKSKVSNHSLLDCKNLSNDELEECFYGNLKYLKDVSNGVLHCERHEQYKNKMLRQKLIINYSTLVFTESQIEYLLDLLGKELDEEGERIEYFLMVLLPELCQKIFREHHSMSQEEAADYLLNRPLDCDVSNFSS